MRAVRCNVGPEQGVTPMLGGVLVSTILTAACTAGIPASGQNVMGPHETEPPGTSIDTPAYDELHKELQVGEDPPILDITGHARKDGRVVVNSMTEFPEGQASDISGGPGSWSINLLDDAGNVTHGVSFEPSFRAYSTPTPAPDGTIGPCKTWESPGGLLGMSLVYPADAATLQFEVDGNVTLELDPLSGTLRTTLESIPDRGYAKNPEQRRRALLNKVDAFEKILAQKSFNAALNKLRNDIRKQVDAWVVEYRSGGILEPSKRKVLIQIERIDLRLQLRKLKAENSTPEQDR